MICNDVQKLIDYAIKKELITNDDIYVVRNQLMEALKLTDWEENLSECSDETIDEILAPLVKYACEKEIISDTSNSHDLFDTKLMGILTPMPREVVAEFNKRYTANPKEATDWYFDFSKKLNYVRAGRIEKDLKWTYDCEYGRIDITINCSKPEKDPRDIAAAKTQKVSAYPECQLCPENAGFAGHATHPARQNLRPVPLTVNNEKWQLQYSPYGYYNEHCIVFNEKHIPMKIDDEGPRTESSCRNAVLIFLPNGEGTPMKACSSLLKQMENRTTQLLLLQEKTAMFTSATSYSETISRQRNVLLAYIIQIRRFIISRKKTSV